MDNLTIKKGEEIYKLILGNLNRYIDVEGDHLASCLMDYISSLYDKEWNKGYCKGYSLGTKNGWIDAIQKMRRTVAEIEEEFDDLCDDRQL